MPDYRIEVSATAERQLRKLAKPEQKRIVNTIRQLAIEPRPRGSRKLHSYNDIYRVRTGKYRIIYSIEDRRLLVIVLKLGHRKDIYRQAP
jgi:mRNA interferase RelE/StbE